MNRIVDRYYKKVEAKKYSKKLQEIIQSGDPNEAFAYADKYRKIIPELEDIISKDAMLSGWYARDVLHGRFEKGEDTISTDAEFSYYYAQDVLKQYEGISRFEKGEAAIKESSRFSSVYAMYVIEGRWIEGEDAISENGGDSSSYVETALKGREKIDVSIKPVMTVMSDENYRGLYIKHLKKKGFSKEDISNFIQQIEYIKGLENYMEVPEIEDIDDEDIKGEVK